MRINLLISLLVPLVLSSSSKSQTTIDSISDSYVINFNISTKSSDTLKLFYLKEYGNYHYFLIYRKDTIYSALQYAKPVDFIRRIDTLKFYNTFLLNEYKGDGCLTRYRLLSFSKTGSLFFSESFGNCNEFTEMRCVLGRVIFSFPKNLVLNLGKHKFIYYRKKQKLRRK